MPLFPLENTHRFKLKCSGCFSEVKSELITPPPPSHTRCQQDILAVQDRATKRWFKVRISRKGPRFYGKYQLCDDWESGGHCCPRGQRCQFAHGEPERKLWSMEKNGQFNIVAFVEEARLESVRSNPKSNAAVKVETAAKAAAATATHVPVPTNKTSRHVDVKAITRDLIQKRVSPLTTAAHDTHAFIPMNKDASQIKTETNSLNSVMCPYSVLEICGECWDKDGSLIQKNGNVCSRLEENHNWAKSIQFVMLPIRKILRPLPNKMSENRVRGLTICRHIGKKGGCKFHRYTRRPCGFPHSIEELEMWKWMLNNSVKTLRDLVSRCPCEDEASCSTMLFFSCQFCSVTCDSQAALEEHCLTNEHIANVNSDKSRQWNHRQPPWGANGRFRLCLKHKEKKCRYSGVGEDSSANLCVDAHSEAELDEWKERFRWKQMQKEAAKEQHLYSYIHSLLDKYHQADIDSDVISDHLPGIEVQCTSDLFVCAEDKNTKHIWKFDLNIMFDLKLEKIALLLDDDRHHFTLLGSPAAGIGAGCQVAPGTQFLTKKSMYHVEVEFSGGMFGLFRQWVIFDFGRCPVLRREVTMELGCIQKREMVKSLQEKLDFDRWTEESYRIVRFPSTAPPGVSDPNAQLLEKYPVPLSVDDIFDVGTIDISLNRFNYIAQMHRLLDIEELTQANIIASFNLETTLTAVKSCTIQGDTFVAAQMGELFGAVQLSDELNEDTDTGRLILWSVSTVLLAPTNNSSNVAYEAKFVEAEMSRGLVKDSIFLRLSPICCQELSLVKGSSLQVEIQFQMNRLDFCRHHLALDLLSDIDVVFPDLSKVASSWKNTIKISRPPDVSSSPLNVDQLQIIDYILRQKPGYYIAPLVVFGAFGTGKTETLARAALSLASRPNSSARILICTHTNTAADEYIIRHFNKSDAVQKSQIKLLRIYDEDRAVRAVNGVVKKYCLFSADRQHFASPSCDAILARDIIVTSNVTSLALGRLGIRGCFTHIFVDEAAQVLECQAIMPLSLAATDTCVVIAGDHLQMSVRVYSSVARERKLHHSIVERLIFHYQNIPGDDSLRPCIRLRRNYRSHPEILRFLSSVYYGGPDVLEPCSVQSVGAETLSALNFFAAQGCETQDDHSTSWHNIAEVEEIVERVVELCRTWPIKAWGPLEPETILVTTPYTDQVQKIRFALRQKGYGIGLSELARVTVLRVHALPGLEYRAVFISAVRSRHLAERLEADGSSADSGDGADYGFLSEPKLLNTAMTRARSWLGVIGDPVAMCSFGDCSRIWRTYLKQCDRLGSIRPSELTLDEICLQVERHSQHGADNIEDDGNAGNNNAGEPNLFDFNEWSLDFQMEPDDIIRQLMHDALDSTDSTPEVDSSSCTSGMEDLGNRSILLTEKDGHAVVSYGINDSSKRGSSDTSVEFMVLNVGKEADMGISEQAQELARLERLTESEPDRFKHCILHIENLKIFACPPDRSVTKIHINKGDRGHGFHGDTVIVEITSSADPQRIIDSEGADASISEFCGKVCGKVVGIVKHLVDPKSRLFVCRVDDYSSGLMVPLEQSIPKIYNMEFRSAQDSNRVRNRLADKFTSAPYSNQLRHELTSARDTTRLPNEFTSTRYSNQLSNEFTSSRDMTQMPNEFTSTRYSNQLSNEFTSSRDMTQMPNEFTSTRYPNQLRHEFTSAQDTTRLPNEFTSSRYSNQLSNEFTSSQDMTQLPNEFTSARYSDQFHNNFTLAQDSSRFLNQLPDEFTSSQDVARLRNDFKSVQGSNRFQDKKRVVRQRRVRVYSIGKNKRIRFDHYEEVDAENADSKLFVVQFLQWKDHCRYPLGIVIGTLPAGLTIQQAMTILNIDHFIPPRFQSSTIKEVEKLFPEAYKNFPMSEMKGRMDLRGQLVFTIDGSDAVELDDALSVQKLGDGSFIVGIHIADVSHFVPHNGAMDSEARVRGTAFYPAHGHSTPMLPPRVGSQLCSLQPGADRLTLTVSAKISSSSNKFCVEKVELNRSVIRSRYQLSYDFVENIILGREMQTLPISQELRDALLHLHKISHGLRCNRLGISCANFLAKNRDNESPNANALVEEFMVLANHEVAKFLLRIFPGCVPLRIQAEPDSSQLDEWNRKFADEKSNMLALSPLIKNSPPGEACDCVGVCLCAMRSTMEVEVVEPLWKTISSNLSSRKNPAGMLITNPDLHPQLSAATSEFRKIQERSIFVCSSEIPQEEHRHSSQNLSAYTNFTSPIRRYLDLVVHRIVISALDWQLCPYTVSEIVTLCTHCTEASLRESSFERATELAVVTQALRQQPASVFAFADKLTSSQIQLHVPALQPLLKMQLSIPLNALCIADRPYLAESKMGLRWSQRIYELKPHKVPPRDNLTSVRLDPDRYVVKIPSSRWRPLLKTIVDRDKERMQVAIQSATKCIKPSALPGEFVKDVTSEGAAVEKQKQYCDFSVELRPSGVVRVQLSTELKRGMLRPRVQLFQLTPTIGICVEHNSAAVLCFAKQLKHSADRERYFNVGLYQHLWQPVLQRESAVNALSEPVSAVIRNVQVTWNKDHVGSDDAGWETRYVGQLKLHIGFCKERQIDLGSPMPKRGGCKQKPAKKPEQESTRTPNKVSPGFFCVRYGSEAETELTGLKMESSEDRNLTWVGHCIVDNVIVDFKETMYILKLRLNQTSSEFPEKLLTSKCYTATVEWIPKSFPDRRIESIIYDLPRSTALAQSIALGNNPRPLEKDYLPHVNRVSKSLLNIRGFKTKPNPGQQRALQTAMLNPFTLIQGPPGTGKTVTAVRLAVLFHKVNQGLPEEYERDKVRPQVMICGPSNKSVDVIAGYLAQTQGSSMRIVRVCSEQISRSEFPRPGPSSLHRQKVQLNDGKRNTDVVLHHKIRHGDTAAAMSIREVDQQIREGTDEIDADVLSSYLGTISISESVELCNADVILCTCTTSSVNKIVKSANINQLIIDECGMCKEAESLVPIIASRARQVVLVGDHRQLEPVVKDQSASQCGLSRSLFERYSHQAVMLTVQYRMHKAIAAFPSKQFYDGRLEIGHKQQAESSRLLFWPSGGDRPIVFINVVGLEQTLTVTTEEGSEQSKSNELEATTALKVVEQLIRKHSVKETEIAVLSQYRAQCSSLTGRLQHLKKVTVSTVISAQGSEWDYVILSTVRSLQPAQIDTFPSLTWQRRYLGFITNEHQINVAITRAKKGLFIIGNAHLLECNEMWRKLLFHYKQNGCVVDSLQL